jgi:PAS domain S-box-containing protein
VSSGDTAHVDGARLVDSAVAVNEAPTVDRALAALTDAAQTLLDADGSLAIVWEDGGELGIVRAGAGQTAGFDGETVRRTWALPSSTESGPPAPGTTLENARSAAMLARITSRVIVPLHFGPGATVTLHAAWFEQQTPERLAEAETVLETLGKLTQVGARAEQELARTREQARLDAVIESVGEAVWIETKDGTKLNGAARELLGLGDDDTTNDLDTEISELDGTPISSDARPRARALETGTTVPFLHKRARPNGTERVFQGSAAPVYAGSHAEPVGTVVTFRDVTEEYNRSLLTERFLELLFEALPLAVAVADPESGEILSVNRALSELVGFAPDEMLGSTPPHAWWADVPDLRNGNGNGTRTGDARTPRDGLFRRADGRLVPVELVPLLVDEAGGAPAAAVTLITDLSERRRFEQQMVQSGKLAAIGELAAGVAHEINNPLFAILGLVEFLLKEVEPGTKPHDRLQLIQQTGLEIKGVVRALLDFARERSDEFETVDLRAVVEQTVELLRRTSLHKEVVLVERYPDDPVTVFASAGQVKQVLLNLVSNAVHAMGESGEIAIELTQEASTAVLRVRDTGPGIEPDVIDRIFDPFFTTKRELGGTGLGLALSQSIADAHGGTLTVASPAGGGAEFTLRIPLEGAAR